MSEQRRVRKAKAVDAFKVEVNARYLIVVKPGPMTSDDQLQMAEHLNESVKNWWQSEQKFLFLILDDDSEVTLERVGEAID